MFVLLSSRSVRVTYRLAPARTASDRGLVRSHLLDKRARLVMLLREKERERDFNEAAALDACVCVCVYSFLFIFLLVFLFSFFSSSRHNALKE